jgi:ssDNA-binding Zn-finger/Zn-ribbon topoisomerase 1
MSHHDPAQCPQCGGPMIQRSGPRGDFLGCRAFPACRGTRPVSPVAQSGDADYVDGTSANEAVNEQAGASESATVSDWAARMAAKSKNKPPKKRP